MSIKSVVASAATILLEVAKAATAIAQIIPMGTAASEGIKLAAAVGEGIANSNAAIVDLYEEIQIAANDPQTKATPEQWAEWNARADKAHTALQAAVKE